MFSMWQQTRQYPRVKGDTVRRIMTHQWIGNKGKSKKIHKPFNTRIPEPVNKHGIRQGFRRGDQSIVDRVDNLHAPIPAILSSYIENEDTDTEDEDEIAKIDYVCADCHNLLDKITLKDKTRYTCRYCYDKSFMDISECRLLTRSDMQEDGVLYVSTDLKKYETLADLREQGTKVTPSIISISPDEIDTDTDQQAYTITYESSDKRIQHRKVTDWSKLSEALAF